MSGSLTIEELYATLLQEFDSETDLHRRGILALHLRDYERGERSEALRHKMSKLLAYRGQRQ